MLETKTTRTIRPPLKWAGGKRWLVPHLQPIWNEHSHRRLVEPFCGGLSVSLGLAPQEALISDINPHLINLYKWLQRGLAIEIDLVNDKDTYYVNRDRFNKLATTGQEDTKEASALFYYLNRTGFNGLCRFNSKGEFNVPFGRYKTINYQRVFGEYVEALSSWVFQQGSFDELEIEDSDFIYADPPYDVEFTKYAKEDFTWDDQVRLAQWLASHSGPVVLSNQATPRIVELYSGLGFRLRFFDAPRRISCTGDRTPAKEVLATRNL
mgnify:CR=1 FL=1